MTLPSKHAIASAAGSLLRRELPTGLRDGDGTGPEGLICSRPKAPSVHTQPSHQLPATLLPQAEYMTGGAI